MNPKKIVSLVLAFSMTVCLCACSKTDSKEYIAVIAKAVNSDFWHNVNNGVLSAATEYNVTVTFEGPENEENYYAQNSLIENAVKNGADAIVLSAIDYNNSVATVNAAVREGVKVIAIDSDVNSDAVSLFIGTDNIAAGKEAGKAAVDGFSADSEIIIGLVNYNANTDNGNQREKGFREVTLLGQNVNSYSFEKDGVTVNFPMLLEKVANEAPNMRIRFVTSHPKDMSDETLRVIAAHNNICKYIHLPAQSGSSKILKVMNRKYTREWYLDRIAAIRRIVPDCAISTDLFCGFHSETEEDYQETLSLMREVGYDSAYLFKYSERPGTYAAKHLEDDVPEDVKVRRLQGMIDLQNKLSEESNKRDIGKTFEVLVEGFSKRSREQLFGRTSQNKVVIFDKGDYKVGQFVNVRVTGATSATLFGEPISE